MRPAFGDFAVIQNENPIRASSQPQIVCDEEGGPPLCQPAKRGNDRAPFSSSSPVVGSSRIRIGALRMAALAIAIRWRWPCDSVTPLAQDRVITLRQTLDKLMGIGQACRRHDFFLGGRSACVGDVVADCRREQQTVLQDDADLRS